MTFPFGRIDRLFSTFLPSALASLSLFAHSFTNNETSYISRWLALQLIQGADVGFAVAGAEEVTEDIECKRSIAKK